MSTSIPKTMRAWQWTKIDGKLENSLVLNTSAPTLAIPAASSDKVLVEVVSSSVNPIDFKLPEITYIGPFIFSKPATPGLDFAGIVRATGSNQFKEGDRVFGNVAPASQHGSLAQFVSVSAKQIAHLPAKTSFDEAACLPSTGLTAYQSVKPHVTQGSTVFVNGGSGGVGTYMVQILKALGCRVIASCSGANAQLVRDLGADEVIDYRSTDLITELKKKGKSFDLVVDLVGMPFEFHKASAEFVKPGGQLVQIGGGMSLAAMRDMIYHAVWPAFLGGATTKWSFFGMQTVQADLEQLADWSAAGKLKSVVDSTWAFEEAPKAYEKLRTGRARGNIVVSTGA